ALASAAKEYNPRPSLLGGCTQMFGAGGGPQPITVPLLAEHASELLNETVRVEGMYETRDGKGILLGQDAQVRIELAGGVAPEGFDAAGGNMEGLPVAVTGTVELQDDVALVRAQLVTPSESILKVRIGRILELQGDYQGAVEAYEQVANDRMLAKTPLGAFARIRAADLAFEELRDEKLARKHYSAAWQPYSISDRDGNSIYRTWRPVPDDGWETIEARKAIAGRLQQLNSKLVAYQIVDFFVRMAGGSHALGVILMAIVVRVAIFPLTKRQLDSSRRMQTIQPQIKELQKRYGDDKQKFQEEFWKLCQENNCNPLGGCLPLLVQMPILIFLYRGIREYIVQFDHTSFLWVRDLAQPDILLLVAYTVSMIFFQKMSSMTQPAADPQQQQQQKMMAYMMPIMFFFLFQSFPAAFILYWLGSNLIYLAEHWIFLRKSGHETEAKPAAAGGETGKKGFASSMLKAINPGKAESETTASSYHDKQKQEKSGKHGKRR
ncbi:MAG: membrane protein insertase YidC, partial [Armatimonadetes bacterium]|nr:membrane protein insertase YidC [Armatimonadota bacterium]